MDAELRSTLETIHEELRRREWLITTAEACTCGMLSETLTAIGGSSSVFRGSVVAYGNRVKSKLLDVGEEMIEEHGSVSAEVAEAMARGALGQLGADLALATTGMAGPGGGTPERPVGGMFVGVATANQVRSRHFQFEGSRREIRRRTTEAALREAHRELTASDPPP